MTPTTSQTAIINTYINDDTNYIQWLAASTYNEFTITNNQAKQ
jgi:hypothetical protein